MENLKLIGPITQLLTLDKLPLKGALKDEQLEILTNAGILIEDDKILEIGDYSDLLAKADKRIHPINPKKNTLYRVF
ncbi:hypothetical protein U3A58_05990 [Algoriphagus sp. C2-6-M1]|uniref:hypothetical protein n=1 Tax=Algoriphagus persicinus TaxID=3108754 RepID=UPI002B3813EA|nr:hypothetical protein [Algoriphagus sp. C2-6-M1]MEB2779939.1 hypothetical protein [Algoriphagus sp. C2-6-M1]